MQSQTIDIDLRHPAFEGHFPGRPIVPGVLLLDRAQRAIEAAHGCRITGLAMAKFLSAATPGDALLLDYEVGESSVKFSIRCGERVVANGRFSRAAAESA